MNRSNQKILVIVGPTAVGKTQYALKMAELLDGEIVSADSMQIYKYMNIGSAKPSIDELATVRHHLVDEVDPRVSWSVADYQKCAKKYIGDILKRGKLPIVSGGTGLYVNSLLYDMDFSIKPRQDEIREKLEQEAQLHGNEWVHDRLRHIDPDASDRIHPNNLKKVIRAIEVYETTGNSMPEFNQAFQKTDDYEWILVGLKRYREELYDRINRRVDDLLTKGLIEEVQHLLSIGLTEDNISMKGIGYKEIIGYLNEEYDKDEAVRLVKRNTRRYAKRQLTWFNRYKEIKWFDLSNLQEPDQAVQSMISYLNSGIL